MAEEEKQEKRKQIQFITNLTHPYDAPENVVKNARTLLDDFKGQGALPDGIAILMHGICDKAEEGDEKATEAVTGFVRDVVKRAQTVKVGTA